MQYTNAEIECGNTLGICSPAVNFTNILLVAFTRTDPKSTKRQSSRQYFLCFWDLNSKKLLVERWWNQYLPSFAWTLEVNFINVLGAAFTHVDPKSAKRQSSCQYFLRFWDLHWQKLLLERWWNWPLMSERRQISSCVRKKVEHLFVCHMIVAIDHSFAIVRASNDMCATSSDWNLIPKM